MNPVIQISDFSYSYRRQLNRFAVQNINLRISDGEFVAIAGRAGSGKSTLCYALNGLIPHSFGGQMHGQVLVDGLDTRINSVPALARRVGFVMQNAESQLVGLTVEEDAAFGLENIALPRNEVAQRVETALAMVGLQDLRKRSPWTLSGGQKQRLSIAAAIAFQPSVLVLDNPTAELDPVSKQEVMATIARLNSQSGITIVIVNQELEEILPYATKLILMDAGRVVSEGQPSVVVDNAREVEAAGVRLPEVSLFAEKLRFQGKWKGQLPLTVEEALKGLNSNQCQRVLVNPVERPSPNLGDPILELRDVSFSYPNGNQVLQRVSLTIRRGEFVTLMGPNGAGKTTLAKHLNGLLVPTSGQVLCGGADTRNVSVAQLARTVGYVFQNPDHQLFCRTVFEELSFGPRNLGFSTAEIENRVEQGLSHLGGKARAKEEPFFMGLAERKLVAIASVLTMGPEVLVLDEPATGADHAAAIRIMTYLEELNRKGLTIVIVTHDVELAANYSHRIVAIQSGRIELDGSPNEVLQCREELQGCAILPPQITLLAHQIDPKLLCCRVDDLVNLYTATS